MIPEGDFLLYLKRYTKGDIKMPSGKKKKREQDQIDTALVIGAGAALVLGILCVIALIDCLGADGASYLNAFINQ